MMENFLFENSDSYLEAWELRLCECIEFSRSTGIFSSTTVDGPEFLAALGL
jgi:hypothetical protein